MMMKKLAAVLIVSAMACGNKDNDKVKKGVFVDSPVLGLHYATSSQSGLTDSAGTFKYQAGETVTFSLGGITLGSAPAAGQITPLDLFGATLPTTQGQLNVALDTSLATPLIQAINVASFLQRLDADGVVSNGIDLTGFDSMLAGATLDFNRSNTNFVTALDDLTVQYAIATTFVPFIDVVLANLYAGLGLSLDAHLVATFTADANADGIPNQQDTYTYDSSGKNTQLAEDNNNDGVPDLVYAFTYDGFGDPLTQTIVTAPADDTAQAEIETWDGVGNVLSQIDTSVKNGANTAVQTFTYTRGNAGNILTESRTDDTNADGTIDSSVDFTYMYDANGRQSGIDTISKSVGAQTEHDVATVTYSAAGDLATQSTLVHMTIGDDSLDVLTYTFDDHHNQLTGVETVDDKNDGSINYKGTTTYTYDGSGNRLTSDNAIDSDNDGTIDQHNHHVLTYDSNNRRLTDLATTLSSAGVVTSTTSDTFAYDDSSNLTSVVETVDSDGDGQTNSSSKGTYTYDSDGNLITYLFQRDTNGDGAYDEASIQSWTYETIPNAVAAAAVQALD